MDGVVCMFTCRKCGQEKTQFTVRWRQKDEDVVEWVEGAVRPALSVAHRLISPTCSAPNADLMIPMDEGAQGIGMRTLN